MDSLVEDTKGEISKQQVLLRLALCPNTPDRESVTEKRISRKG